MLRIRSWPTRGRTGWVRNSGWQMAVRLEAAGRRHLGLTYRLVGEICDPPDGSPKRGVKARLARELRVNRGEVDRRAKLAARVRGRRVGLGPEVMDPELPRLAKRCATVWWGRRTSLRCAKPSMPCRSGCRRWKTLGGEEAGPARQEAGSRVCGGGGAGDQDRLNPDGVFDEADRKARRNLTMGPQGPDGMSKISGTSDPGGAGLLRGDLGRGPPGTSRARIRSRPSSTRD